MTKDNPIQSREERDLLILKAQQERDRMFKLVVKIISWETDSLNSIVVRSLNKITNKEWNNYKKHALAIPTTLSMERVKEKLEQTFKDIKQHGGFE